MTATTDDSDKLDFSSLFIDVATARSLDSKDALASLRKEYYLPSMRDVNVSADSGSRDEDLDATSLYFCGNSLGPLTRRSKQYVEEELSAWGRKAVLGHWDHPFGRPWTKAEERASILMADIVGAKPREVIAMSTLTNNLHTMLATFYRPQHHSPPGSAIKHKIIYEAQAFPSDQYALASAVALAGHDPRTSLIALHPRDGQRILQTEDILSTLEREAATGEVALVLMGGLQYLTGQVFDMQAITKRAHELDIIVGIDLAHAFANIPLALHDWQVDFAIWCTYKYGSSGPGGIAGLYVHDKWGQRGFKTYIGREASSGGEGSASSEGLVRTAGWWGHDKSTRFSMPDSFSAMTGAAGWQMSNPSALDLAALLGSLETLAKAPSLVDTRFDRDLGSHEHAEQVNSASLEDKIGSGYIMPALRQKSEKLTAYLEHLLMSKDFLPAQSKVSVVTPSEPRFRGSQLSICIPDILSPPQQPNGGKQVADSVDKTRSDVPPPVTDTTFVAKVHKILESNKGVICDIRKPDMLRLAPLAQYSTFEEVWRASQALKEAIEEVLKTQQL